MAVDERGFLRPTYEELLENRIEQAKTLFGEDIDTSEYTALGKFIRLSVYDLETAWEQLEYVYYARFPNTASGTSLDRLLPFAGISRNPATAARHTVKFTGIKDFEIPVGFIVGTDNNIQFYLENPVTIGEDGTATGTVACTQLGTAGNVPIGAISIIVNPSASVNSVQHLAVIELGENTETDNALRERFTKAILGSGSSTASSIYGAIMRISGVKDCTIIENDTEETDSAGRPSHCFETYVYAPGSLDNEIAQTIFEKKPLGIQTYGTTTVTVVGDETTAKGGIAIKFTHVVETVIKVKATVKYDDDFPADGISQIKLAIMEYISGLGSGGDVILSALYGRIHSVPGVRETSSLQIAADSGEYAASNITVTPTQVATTSTDDITIEVSRYVDS